MSETQVAAAPAPAPAPAPVQRRRFAIEVLKTIKESQQSHGLRYDDYMRYRQYCSRRLRRLRKSSGFTQKSTSGGKLNIRDVTIKNCETERILLIPLIVAERAWAHAMEIRAKSAAGGGNESSNAGGNGIGGNNNGSEDYLSRKEQHLIRRLKKAEKHAHTFETLCAERGTSRTALEAEAYHCWMVGNVNLEIENWSVALEKFVRITAVYEQLQNISSESDRSLLQERIDEVDPFIRFCRRHLERQGEGEFAESLEAASKELMDLEMAAGSGASHDMLKAKLERVLNEQRKKQSGKGGKEVEEKIEWLGRVVVVKGERVRHAMLTARNFAQRLATSAGSGGKEGGVVSNKTISDRMVMFDKTLTAFNDALGVLRSEKGESLNKEDAAIARAYVSAQILKITMDRNQLIAEDYVSRLNRRALSLEGRPVTANDIAGLYDRLAADLDEYAHLPVADRDENVQREVAARSLYFRAARTLWLAMSYLIVDDGSDAAAAAADSAPSSSSSAAASFLLSSIAKIPAENLGNAAALLQRSVSVASAAISRLAQIPELRQDLDRCQSVEATARGKLCSIQADIAIAASPAAAAVSSSASEITSASSTPLLARLESYEAAVAAGSNPKLVDFPPTMEAVPGKPVLFDLAFNSIQAPDLSSRIKKKGGVFGWLKR